MIINKRIIWIPVVITALAFPIYLLANKIEFLSVLVAKVIFWVGIGIGAFLVILELIALSRNFINEHFATPMKKAKEYFSKVESERKEIKELLDFEIYGNTMDDIQDHHYELEQAEFSKEALAPYLIQWYNHLDQVQSRIQEEDLKDFEKKKETLIEEINQLKKEKEWEQKSEEKQISTKKEEFLEEHEDRLHIEATDLTDAEREWLEEEGYKSTHQWCIHNKESTEFMVKPRHNESLSHAYLTGAIHDYIKDEGLDNDVQMYETKMPDIVFSYGGFKWAIEVETGKVHAKSKKQLMEKVKMLNKNYPQQGWFFVVTNKNLLPKYRKFGDAIDRSNVIDKLEGIFYPEGYPEEE